MTRRSRKALSGLCASAALLASAVPAAAYWESTGSGTGSGTTATMPAGNQPTASVSGQSVTVSWTQSSFHGSALSTFGGGGYTIARYANGSSTATTPNAGCATTISGATCTETGVAYGAWQYVVTPVLGTFTGAQSPKSVAVSVVTAAPAIAVAAQNPGAAQTTGDLQISWPTVTGATGYRVYRRTTGAFDFASPVASVTGSSYTDPGSGLVAATTYHYVVRAIAGSPPVESPSSGEVSATTISRPAAPASVTATAVASAHVNVSWPSVSGVAGYNVYRRTSAGAYNFAAPLNGVTPVAATSYADTTAVNATSYLYVVRAVIIGASSAQVESASSAESATVIADGIPAPAPLTLTVTSGGNVMSGTSCSVASGTRFINNAGKSSVGVTVTIAAAPEAGESFVFTATTPGSSPVVTTVAATAMSQSTTLNLSTLLDGTVTLTVQTIDAAGNLSATHAPSNPVVKDIVAGALSGLSYQDKLLGADDILGSSECGATIIAVETAPGSTTYTSAPETTTSFTLPVAGLALTTYSYNVTATDLAGNTSAIIVVTGSLLL